MLVSLRSMMAISFYLGADDEDKLASQIRNIVLIFFRS